MNRPSVWMIGDCEDAQFAPAAEFLRRETGLQSFPDVQESLASSCQEPDVFILAAARPGRFSADQIEQLHCRAPLARLVALLGSWCEGEVRSGYPWPGVTRIYAHQWQARLPAEINRWQPRTATEVDRLFGGSGVKSTRRRIIGVLASQRSMFEALAAACRPLGQEAVWLAPNLPLPVQRVDAIVCDATLDLVTELSQLSELRARLRQPPAVLLLDFPRQSELAQADASGVASVLARPFLIADLAAEIERITATPSAQRLIAAA